MKKIIKPSQREEAVYYSDFSGKCFGELYPPVNLTLDFNYGSAYDGSKLKFDLNDEDIESVLPLLKSKLNNEIKEQLKYEYEKLEKDFEDSMQMRDWDNCDYICNNKQLLEKLI